MQWVPIRRFAALALAGLLTVAAASSTSAVFEAPAPGANLRPVGGAEVVIDLIQGNEALLWSALSGTVTSYHVLGWPTRTGDSELGGALVIEAPTDGTAGVIHTGEKPMSVRFEVAG